MKAMTSLALLTLALPTLALASETDQQDWIDKLLTELGSSETINVEEGIDWGVLPGPFVNPEQGFGFGVAAVGLYAPSDWVETTPYSTVAVKSYVSTSGSYGLGVENRTYLNGDTLRLLADGWISHAPGYYWGIGRDAAENSDNKTKQQAQILKLSPKVSYQFLSESYITVGWDFQRLTHQESDGPILSGSALDDAISSGAVMALEYDSRDFEPNPERGRLVSAEWVSYRDAFGSDFNYDRFTLNYREYQRLSKDSILAWDIYGQGVTGDVPWYAYSELGSDKRMRGYYIGQYRDRYQLSAQMEWRHQFNARHGMVTWVGAGNIAPDADALFDNSWLPTAGIGYRFAFKPRINVRFDFGIGKDSSGFYFHINEAF
ncbi:BamA/TamA family outer membrane protein [Grimontia sp. SpTr1]|uniref:BamA/TamA family outer membrane protein n=1 Tax=Grimontia sp. SpTr1 TaxID=2995319 RepID=UPI00248B7C69|nr:BamA/TamA family outer membrane protein [Grimontia sp. SpTr1]